MKQWSRRLRRRSARPEAIQKRANSGTTYPAGGRFNEAERQKIDIGAYEYVTDSIGNRKKRLVTIATVWACFRQLSMKEYYGVITQVEEQVLFQIGYRADITTANVITYKGVDYEIGSGSIAYNMI